MAKKLPIQNLENKGSKQEMLPHRAARAQLTGGDVIQRSMSNYAKLTPGVGDESPSITDLSTINYS